MPAPLKSAAPRAEEGNDSAAVDAFLAQLQHPLKDALQAVRRAVLTADPAITEGIKWNSPSFYRQGWFATLNLRAKDGPQLVFHLGAKTKVATEARAAVPDPAGLLRWLGPDRAAVALGDAASLPARLPALRELAGAWSRLLA